MQAENALIVFKDAMEANELSSEDLSLLQGQQVCLGKLSSIKMTKTGRRRNREIFAQK